VKAGLAVAACAACGVLESKVDSGVSVLSELE
jgi:hypothetical protein